MGFRKNMLTYSKRLLIVTKFGMSVDRDAAQLSQGQIFDICPSVPEKILLPFKFFLTITVNGTENFNLPYHLAFLANLDEICATHGQQQSPSSKKFFRNQNSPNSKKCNF